MKLIEKKQAKGNKTIAIVDTQGADIVDIVRALSKDGWEFPKIVVSYTSKGAPAKKAVPAAKVAAVQAKYHFDKWSFSAVKGQQFVEGQVNNATHRALVARASKAGVSAFMSVAPSSGHPQAAAPRQKRPQEPSIQGEQQLTPQQQALLRRKQEMERQARQNQQQQQAPTSQVKTQRSQAAEQAAESLYSDDGSGMTERQRSTKRAQGRARDDDRVKKAAANKHTGLMIWAIVECLCVLPIAFALCAIWDILAGRRIAAEDPVEAETRFKNAKELLICGIVEGVALGAFIGWHAMSYLS